MQDAIKKTLSKIATCFSVFIFISGIILATLLWRGYNLFSTNGSANIETNVIIKNGTSLDSIARKLEAIGVIDNFLLFKLGVKISGNSQNMKAGEFLFPAHSSPKMVMNIIKSGKTVTRKVTIPEGLTSYQVIGILSKKSSLKGDIKSLPKEGELLPETYHYSYGDKREDIIKRMKVNASKTLDELWSKRSPNLPFKNPYEALILASIVEKETAIASERPRIASVFINRLKKNMRLQSDPTVIYALSAGKGDLERSLFRNDLKVKSPFNTYKIKGLPPTPICNVGYDAINAVLHPLKTNDLYFVADGTGGHVFAKNLEDHNKNVSKWRRYKKLNGIK